MKLWLKIFSILSLLHALKQVCSEGCLRCTSGSQCNVCDYKRNYHLSTGNTCAQTLIANCAKTDAAGGCYTCQNGTYYQSQTKLCLPAAVIINNCKTFSGPTTCSVCVQGHYLDNSICKPVTQPIANCVTNSSATVCSECRAGFIPNATGTACSAADLNICANYRNYQCSKCDSAHSILNKNGYLIKPFTDGNPGEIQSLLTTLSRAQVNASVNSFCMETTVSNCLIYVAYNKCDTCNDGYILTEDLNCKLLSSNSLFGCQVFSSFTTCQTCLNGYYMSSGNCVESTPVKNCEQFSKTLDKCDACDNLYFLNAGQCEIRTIMDANCESYQVDSDRCETCATNYVTGEGQNECFKLPDNCVRVGNADFVTPSFTCSKCEEGYYVEGGNCVEGSIENCRIYQDDQPSCLRCEDGFIIFESNCVEIVGSIDNCNVYEPASPLKCETCSDTSISYDTSTICKPLTVVDECAEYGLGDNCFSCQLGYELLEKECVKIDEAEHCLIKTLGACTKCTPDHNLSEDGDCVHVPDEILANCATPNSELLGTDFECIGCALGYVPFEGLEEGCVNPLYIDLTPIPNCIKYINEQNEYLCKQCDLEYILSENRSECVESCGDGQVQYMGKISDTDGTLTISAFAQCLSIDDFEDLPLGCAIASENLSGDGNVCLQCAAGYIPIEQCTLDTTFFNVNDLSSIVEGQAFPVVSCHEKTEERTLVPSAEQPDANCLYYLPIGNKYYCNQCVFGKTGVITVDGSDQSYVDCSDDVEGCDADFRYGTAFTNQNWVADMYGLSLHELSCHKCSEAGEIPFIHLDDESGLRPYGAVEPNQVPSSSADPSGQLVACRAPTAEGLSVSADKFTAFVENCALGLLVVDVEQNVATSDSAARCIACKDGFKPSFDEKGFFISSCEAIENCGESTTSGWLNGCKNCANGFVKIANDDSGIDPHDCSTEVDAPNCRIYDTVQEKCAACERGFTLDADDVCTELKFPLCSAFTAKTKLSSRVYNNETNFSYAYYFGATGFDCFACEPQHVSVKVEYLNEVCVQHPNIEEQSADADSNYPNDCAEYTHKADAIICNACSEGFVVSSDGLECFDAELLTGCSVATSESICEECSDSFIINGGACLEKEIENCSSFSVVNNKVVCLSCINGTKLDKGGCVAGNVPNCETYDEEGDCDQCKPNFALLLNACIPIASSLNCEAASLDVESSSIACQTCKSGFYLEELNQKDENVLCIQGPVISGCVDYNESFGCQRCGTSTFLYQGKCISRVYSGINCSVTISDGDGCATCNDGFAPYQSECWTLGDIVPYCKYYSGNGVCYVCGRNRVFSNNQCVLIAENSLINNCKYYNNSMQCYKCEDDHLLVGNSCVLKGVTGCASYTSENVCATCPSGMIFKTTNDAGVFKRECISPPSAIENCAEVNPSAKNCRICSKGYYLSNKVCVQVPSAIPNCKYNNNATTCATCETGFVKSIDGLACTSNSTISTLETHCTDLRFVATPVCSTCRSGFYFDTKGCVPCSSNKPTDGCMYCNPITNSKCLVCASGFNMNSAGTCVISTSGIEAAEEFDDLDEGTGKSATFAIFTVLILAFVRY